MFCNNNGRVNSAIYQTSRHGFSMMELMAVMVIIGLIAVATTVAIRGQVRFARVATTKITLNEIISAIETFELTETAYPTEAEGLERLTKDTDIQKLLNPRKLNDVWGSPFVYEVMQNPGPNDEPFQVYSIGPDKKPGTSDDIFSELAEENE